MLKRLSVLFLFMLVCQTSAASATPTRLDFGDIVSDLIEDNVPYVDGVIVVKIRKGSNINHIVADYQTEMDNLGIPGRSIYLLTVPPELPSTCPADLGKRIGIDSAVIHNAIVKGDDSEDENRLLTLTMEYQFAACLYLDPRVVIAHPNYVDNASEANPRGSYSWDGNVKQEQSEQYALTLHNYQNIPFSKGANSIVAILDTGVDATHPYLNGYVLPGYDVIGDDVDPDDEKSAVDADGDGMLNEAWGHGTHVAGIVHMIAPQAKILPVRVLDSDGHGTVYDVALGIEYALSQNVDVINLSLSSRYRSPILEKLLQNIADQNVLLVASAGNVDDSRVRYPAGYDNVIAVAAIDENSQKTDFSSYGDWITVSAAGSMIRSSVPEGDGFAYWSGTSMAAPFVSGVAALLYSADSRATADKITQKIINTSVNIDALNPAYDGELGAGRLDIGAAVRSAQLRSALGD